MAGRADAPGGRGNAYGSLVGRFGCILMIVVNVLIVTGLVLLAHAAASVSTRPVDDPGLNAEVSLALNLTLAGFALDLLGISVLGLAHLLSALGLRSPSARSVAPLGIAAAVLAFAWAAVTQAWRSFFPPPGPETVRQILVSFDGGDFDIARYVSFGGSDVVTPAYLMITAAVLLLVVSVLSSGFLNRVAGSYRVARKFHLAHWPVLATVNLLSSVLLAVSLLGGGGQGGITSLGAIAGGGLKLLLVPTLGITVYLSVYRNFQDLRTAQSKFPRPAVALDRILAPISRPAPVAAAAAAVTTSFAAGPERTFLPQTAPAVAARAALNPRPEANPMAVRPAEPVSAGPRDVGDLTEAEAQSEVQRHEAAIRRVEDLYLSGQLEIGAYADLKRTRSARLALLRARLEPPKPAVPQPSVVLASPAPELRPPVLSSARTQELAPSTRSVNELTMEEISAEIARNQKAVAAVEEMLRGGEIDEELSRQVAAARRGRNLDLQSRYEELRFDLLTQSPMPRAEDPESKEVPDMSPEELPLPEELPPPEDATGQPPEEPLAAPTTGSIPPAPDLPATEVPPALPVPAPDALSPAVAPSSLPEKPRNRRRRAEPAPTTIDDADAKPRRRSRKKADAPAEGPPPETVK